MGCRKTQESFLLNFAEENETVIVDELMGGHHFREKCLRQGILPGQAITMVCFSGRGACLVMVNDTRVILGHGFISRIKVRRR